MWRRSWCWKDIKVCISVKVYVVLGKSTLDKVCLLCGGCCTLPDLLFPWALYGSFFVIHLVVFQEVPLFLSIINGIKNAPYFQIPCHRDAILKPSYRKVVIEMKKKTAMHVTSYLTLCFPPMFVICTLPFGVWPQEMLVYWCMNEAQANGLQILTEAMAEYGLCFQKACVYARKDSYGELKRIQ